MGKKSTSNTSSKAKSSSSSAGKKPPMKARILSALASQQALGKKTVPKSMIAKLCSVTNHHTFDTTCAALKNKCLVEYHGKGSTTEMHLTDAGYDEIGPDAPAPVTTNDEAQETLRNTLKVGKSKEMFDFLAQEGKAHTRGEIAEHVGMDESKKTFKTYISYLSKIVEKVDGGDGKIQLIDDAFPFGRPCDKP
jgi:hypothetical protein